MVMSVYTGNTHPTLKQIFPFDSDELKDLAEAAKERGISIRKLIHDAVMNDLFK
jgi:hypothetical protein